MSAKEGVELVAAATMPITIVSFLAYRAIRKMGIGLRNLQFLAIAFFTPMILMLALEGILEHAVVGTLIGGLLGYFFSQLSNESKDT
jgi:hypothetical protein